MEWIPVIFGFLGLGVSVLSVVLVTGIAGLSLYISYKERKAALRNALYEKQIEVYEELIDSLNSFDKEFKKCLFWFKEYPESKEASELEDNSYNSFHELERNFYKWSIFFPNDVNKNFFKYLKTCHKIYNSILDYYESSKPYDVLKKDMGILSDSYALVLDSIRRAVGTEPLSKETLKMFGEMPRQLKEEIDKILKST